LVLRFHFSPFCGVDCSLWTSPFSLPGRMVPSIVEPDHASVLTRSIYAEANLCSRTFGRSPADGATGGSPTRCCGEAASCSPWPVVPSWTLVQSPPLPWWPLGLLVNENRQVPGGPNCERERRATIRNCDPECLKGFWYKASLRPRFCGAYCPVASGEGLSCHSSDDRRQWLPSDGTAPQRLRWQVFRGPEHFSDGPENSGCVRRLTS